VSSAQAKPISELLEDFEQSLRTYRPSTRRVYVAGARAAIRAASLEFWQSPSATELLASIGRSPTEKRARISPFLDFLGGGGPKQSASQEDWAALQNWVIQRIAKQMRVVRNPSITSRRDSGLIAALCAGSCQRNSSKMAPKLPQNYANRSAALGGGNPGTVLRSGLTLLVRLEGAAGPAGPTASLPANLWAGPNHGSFFPAPMALP